MNTPSASSATKSVSVQHYGKTETFHFAEEKQCKKWTDQYSALAGHLSEAPKNGIEVSAQLQLILEFEHQWGKERVPATTLKAKTNLKNHQFLPQGTVIPLDNDAAD